MLINKSIKYATVNNFYRQTFQVIFLFIKNISIFAKDLKT